MKHFTAEMIMLAYKVKYILEKNLVSHPNVTGTAITVPFSISSRFSKRFLFVFFFFLKCIQNLGKVIHKRNTKTKRFLFFLLQEILYRLLLNGNSKQILYAMEVILVPNDYQ